MSDVPAEVRSYLAGVKGERGESLRAVFDTVRTAMPPGFHLQSFQGAPHWVVPLSDYPDTRNKEPLSNIAIMAQKHYNSIYLMGLYRDPDEVAAFQRAWVDAGLKLDMGKSCLRFRTMSDVDLAILADTAAALPPERVIAIYERAGRA